MRKTNPKLYRVLILTVSLIGASSTITATAASIYVDNQLLDDCQGTYSIANRDASGSDGDAYNTIQEAANIAVAGDTVFIRGGTYTGNENCIKPAHSGTSDTSRITYTNYGNENVTITDAQYGVRLADNSYVTIHGINFDTIDRGIHIARGSHNHIEYCTFNQMRTYVWYGSYIYDDSQYNWVHHCNFSRWGQVADRGGGELDDWGTVLDVGSETATDDQTHYNLFENNNFFYGGHHVMRIHTEYNIIRNNYFHNEEWMPFGDELYGNRNLVLYGEHGNRNLVEGNRIAFSGKPPDDPGSSGMKICSQRNIIRFNAIYYNDCTGIHLAPIFANEPSYNYIYHNTIYHNGYNPEYYHGGLDFCEAPATGNVIKNNLFFDNIKGIGIVFEGTARRVDQIIENNWEEVGDPLFVDTTVLGPFDPSLPDFHLQRESPCIDAGGSLTKTTGAGENAKVMAVEDAGYFMDGWGVIEGDVIQLEGQTQTARITDVDYDNNSITVDTPLSWAAGQGLSLAYAGNAPDMGAYEYVSGPPDTTAPSVPQNLTATAVSESQIDLSWNASSDPESGIDYYKIYRDSSQIDTSVTTSYSNTALNSETTYSYEVSAVNGQGLESGRSNTAQATTFSDTTPPLTYSITASAGSRGQISPSGITQVVSGGSQTYEITADTGYHIWDVLVDGSSVGATSSYRFTNVTDNHTIAAIFAVEIAASAGSGGQIRPSGTTRIAVGGSQTYDITPDTGYHTADVLVDGSSVGAVSSYSFTNVTDNHTIAATFDINTYTITASAGNGGLISPSGTTHVNWGGTQSYTITPNTGYRIVDVLVDGSSVGKITSYSFTNVTSDHTVAATFGSSDVTAPTVTNPSPQADAIQAALNTLITFHISDSEDGVDPTSVTIEVNGDLVYTGDTDHYNSPYGDCRRTGTPTAYRFFYQSNDMFDYDQMVTVTVNASDLASPSNSMSNYSYSFMTEMHSFGQNKPVNSGLHNNDRPVTVCDGSGNIWAAWHAGPIDNRDIYVGELAAGEEDFGSTVQLTDNTADQCNPAIALDSNNKIYVVWQDNRQGDWDIYVSTFDGTSWSPETTVNDPGGDQVNPAPNQVNPAIVVDSQNDAHVVWQDDLAGNQDIFIATSSDGFATKTVSQITSDRSDQIKPAVAAAADLNNTIYVVWTDGRNGSNNIYGAASDNPWMNVAIVSNTNNQSSPAIATESTGSILHLLWVDDTPGSNDIYYASSSGLPGSPLTGSSIIDDSSGASQLDPTIAVTGSTDNHLKVFAGWQDWRNADTDLYFAELSAGSGTNVLVGDGGSNADQGEPATGIGEYGHPYMVWADNRSTDIDIYYAGSTFIEPVALASELVTASASSSTTVGTDPQAITTIDDVSVVVPAGACSCDVTITVARMVNPPAFSSPCLGGYDFGPSGIQFNQPVTITIPYAFSGSDSSVTPYWFSSMTRALSQEGIADIRDISISSSLHALSFKTTHFTAFYLLAEGGNTGGGGSGGGCSVSASGEGSIIGYMLPYMVLAVAMTILKMRDARDRKARNMTAGKC